MTTTRRWIRLDVDWDTSEWLDGLPVGARFAWLQLLCYAKKSGASGRVKRMAVGVFARRNDIEREDVQAMIDAATEGGALHDEGGDWVLTNWTDYQPDNTAAERMRRMRERERIANDD